MPGHVPAANRARTRSPFPAPARTRTTSSKGSGSATAPRRSSAATTPAARPASSRPMSSSCRRQLRPRRRLRSRGSAKTQWTEPVSWAERHVAVRQHRRAVAADTWPERDQLLLRSGGRRLAYLPGVPADALVRARRPRGDRRSGHLAEPADSMVTGALRAARPGPVRRPDLPHGLAPVPPELEAALRDRPRLSAAQRRRGDRAAARVQLHRHRHARQRRPQRPTRSAAWSRCCSAGSRRSSRPSSSPPRWRSPSTGSMSGTDREPSAPMKGLCRACTRSAGPGFVSSSPPGCSRSP